jgi:hypothetical protein
MRAQITASASTMSHYLKSEFSVNLLLIIFSLQASIEGGSNNTNMVAN